MSHPHLLLAVVFLPFAGGITLWAFPRRALALGWVLGQAILVLAFARLTWLHGPVGYAFGGWPSSFAITFRADALGSAALFAATWVLLAVFAFSWKEKTAPGFYPLCFFLLFAVTGIFFTADVFNLFVFFEVALMVSYGLVVTEASRTRLRAAIHYLAANLLASTIFFLGAASLYAVTGTLSFSGIEQFLLDATPESRAPARLAASLVLFAFFVKAGQFPFSFWLPAAYSVSTGSVSAIFAALMTKLGVFAIFRVMLLAFLPLASDFRAAMLVLGLATALAGALASFVQTTLRRVLAQLVIHSAGMMLVAGALGSGAGWVAGWYYFFQSILLGGGFFLLASVIGKQRGVVGERFLPCPNFSGRALLSVLFLFASATWAGLPPTSGFFAKKLILLASGDAAPWVWPPLLLSSLLVVLSLGRAGVLLFWRQASRSRPLSQKMPGSMILGSVLLLLATALFTLYTLRIESFLERLS